MAKGKWDINGIRAAPPKKNLPAKGKWDIIGIRAAPPKKRTSRQKASGVLME
ncbi:hypothetical protein SIO70_19965 [Chitinophaga sancti]|uniref:hypothetical protein n=1 Tax=Chitinophaga sancti TaxID=1004 RepID=UPI002A750FA6|nr:hypothetical protein [Chitinophaga sancti]WPQ60631.1 hypothetical protein SIO70_19965 [Chitinophaga sancti]